MIKEGGKTSVCQSTESAGNTSGKQCLCLVDLNWVLSASLRLLQSNMQHSEQSCRNGEGLP